MKRLIILFSMVGLLFVSQTVIAQDKTLQDTVLTATTDSVAVSDSTATDLLLSADIDAEQEEGGLHKQLKTKFVDGNVFLTDLLLSADIDAEQEEGGLHKQLKTKFVDGNVFFMSLVALALVLGLAFCIERIIYLTLSEIKSYKLMEDIEAKLKVNDVEGAKTLCRNTRGPVASVCYQGLLHIHQSMDAIERSITNYGGLQAANLEKGCSWIKLFIAMAPSLGFLGTVIGMVMAFDQIQQAGDIGPTIVAQGRYGDGLRPDPAGG